MARFKDTEINGNLNVTEDVQIGDMSVSEKLDELNTNITILTPEIVTNEYGTAIKHPNGIVEQFGSMLLANANDYVAQSRVYFPVLINIDKDFSLTVSRYNQDNGAWGLNSSVSYGDIISSSATLTLQNPGGGYGSSPDKFRTVYWHLIGFYA
jgi:hypothetical protein